MATHHEFLNNFLRRELAKKQREMAKNIANVLDAEDSKERHAAQVAVRRNEKSIALLVSKLLCTHPKIYFQEVRRNGSFVMFVRCGACTTTAMK